MESVAAPNESQAGLRACDQCRTRKIRCDRGRPCANCRTSGLTCLVTGIRAKEHRQRVLISSKYEHKIDSIGDRLTNIEEILRDLAIATRGSAEEASRAKSSPAIEETSIFVASAVDPSSTIRHFEGATSLSAYNTTTSNHLQRRFHNTRLLSIDPDLAAALSSLHQTVSEQGLYPYNQQLPTTQTRTKTRQKYSMPPAEVVSQVLRDVKEVYDSVISLFYPITPYKSMISLCKDIYFNIDDMSTASLIVAFGSLSYIFKCYYLTFTTEDPWRADFEQYSKTLAQNMMDLLGQLPLFVAASDENVEALLLAAYYAIQSSEPLLCSILTSKAANLCLTMGYHRVESMTNDSLELRERKISIFWFLYILDKGLCLRLGRAAIVQDYDITIPMSGFRSADRDRTGIFMIQFWIKLSEIQGRVYEELFSPRALKRDTCSRTAKCEALVFEIRDLWAEHNQIGRIPNAPVETFELFLLANKVVLSTTLTLILRAMPPADDRSLSCSQECVTAARQALELHQTCAAQYGTMFDKYLFSEYLHWALLHTPFTPFLVIFSHIINNQSTDDLKLLSDFVGTLQPARGVSSSVEKMFLLCDVFYHIARLFLEAVAKSPSYPGSTTPHVAVQPRKELDPLMTRIEILPSGVDSNNKNRYDNDGANMDMTQSDPSYGFDVFASMPNIGDWVLEDQLITTLVSNFNFLDPTTAQAGNNGGGII